MKQILLLLGALTVVLPAHAVAQVEAQAAVARPVRASWLSDRRPLRAGDLLTIVVDERTLASERSSAVARSVRSQDASIASDPVDAEFGIGYGARSDQTGSADRSGRLTGVLSVSVVTIEPSGLARIEGRKTVTIDGRVQDLVLTGLVRPEDVTASNTILSTRVADAVLTYKGKKLGPSTGIIGRLLGLLWP